MPDTGSRAAPAISFVVPTDTWAAAEEPVGALAAQADAAEIELVLVAPDLDALGSPLPSSAALHSVNVVEFPILHPGEARHAGVRASRGDLVALGETHVAPAPGWSSSVRAAHAAGADVVIPHMQNRNPGTALSWAAFLMDYGRCAAAGNGDRLPPVPIYNATFRRSFLLRLDDPAGPFSPGTTLGPALRRAGAAIAVEPAAVVAHLNVDRGRDWVRERYLGGLLTAAGRGRGWSLRRRIAYAGAFPLIAIVIFARVARLPRSTAPRRVGLALLLGSLVSAWGEAAGYLGRVGNARTQMLEYETHKRAYVRPPR